MQLDVRDDAAARVPSAWPQNRHEPCPRSKSALGIILNS